MSYSKLLSVLENAKEGTLIYKVVCSDTYSALSDTDKKQYPILHCMITGGTPIFNANGTMFNNWIITSNLYTLPESKGSKSDLTAEDINNLNIELEKMASNYCHNIYYNSEINNIESIDFTTSIPTQVNGANVWQISMTINMLNYNICYKNNC